MSRQFLMRCSCLLVCLPCSSSFRQQQGQVPREWVLVDDVGGPAQLGLERAVSREPIPQDEAALAFFAHADFASEDRYPVENTVKSVEHRRGRSLDVPGGEMYVRSVSYGPWRIVDGEVVKEALDGSGKRVKHPARQPGVLTVHGGKSGMFDRTGQWFIPVPAGQLVPYDESHATQKGFIGEMLQNLLDVVIFGIPNIGTEEPRIIRSIFALRNKELRDTNGDQDAAVMNVINDHAAVDSPKFSYLTKYGLDELMELIPALKVLLFPLKLVTKLWGIFRKAALVAALYGHNMKSMVVRSKIISLVKMDIIPSLLRWTFNHVLDSLWGTITQAGAKFIDFKSFRKNIFAFNGAAAFDAVQVLFKYQPGWSNVPQSVYSMKLDPVPAWQQASKILETFQKDSKKAAGKWCWFFDCVAGNCGLPLQMGINDEGTALEVKTTDYKCAAAAPNLQSDASESGAHQRRLRRHIAQRKIHMAEKAHNATATRSLTRIVPGRIQ